MTPGDIVLLILSIIGIITYCVILLMHVIAICYAKFRLYPKLDFSAQEERKFPGVSILKPICGMEVNLEENLRSFMTLKYPVYEIIFCVQDSTDPVIELINRLIKEYPQVNCRIFAGASSIGVNPKINNMFEGYKAAKEELLLISDSGLLAQEDMLMDMVLTMESDETIGLVHQVPFLNPSCVENFSHLYQLMFFGGWHAKMYMSANYLGFNCVTGMSTLMRAQVLKDVGLQSFSSYLAEDFFIAKHFMDRNYKCVVSRYPALQNTPAPTISGFRQRLKRWFQLRIAMVPHVCLVEPLTYCLPIGILMALSLSYLFPYVINPAVYILCHILVWFLLDYLLFCTMRPPGTVLTPRKFEFFAAWMTRESVNWLLHLKYLLCSKTVIWRGRRFHISLGGVTKEIPVLSSKTTGLSINSDEPPSNDCHVKIPLTNVVDNNDIPAHMQHCRAISADANFSSKLDGLRSLINNNYMTSNLHKAHIKHQSDTTILQLEPTTVTRTKFS